MICPPWPTRSAPRCRRDRPRARDRDDARALDARQRRSDSSAARYDLVIDRDTGEVAVEISVSGPLPVLSIVEEVQRAVQLTVGDPGAGRSQALVRFQSLGKA
ncbi:hypothetical protein [Brachybacterium tyrofermentans]|uniref:hypothetical protein n=1 Tax=Brachybacterium tyrofermentans TaxID=47848 RepID=UPI001865CBBA|nr:hypothetical protein [Brachybacterium tyrofermentans]